MGYREPYIAKLDEVIITRQGDTAIIEYKEENVYTVHLKFANNLDGMSDQEILDQHNENISARFEFSKNYNYVATEIPPGSSQIKYFEPGGYWTQRGDVLRCIVASNGQGDTMISVDDKEFTMDEFGKLISPYEGWGMRVIMVPDDELYQSPPIEIKDPEKSEQVSLLLSEKLTLKAEH